MSEHIDNRVTMKPLLALAIDEALRLALKDATNNGEISYNDMDIDALAQSLSCRLLGYGGWMVGDMYIGNSSPQQILHACIPRPERNPLEDVVTDLGLEPIDPEPRLKPVK